MQYFRQHINLFIILIIFIILCFCYALIIPVFEAPDEQWHFMYAFYISKYNRISSVYNEGKSIKQYIDEHTEEDEKPTVFMDDKYLLFKLSDGGYGQHKSLWHPPTYYFISAQILKLLKLSTIDLEYNYNYPDQPNVFINNKILENRSPTNYSVLILRLFQIIYGILIIIFIYKIIKLLSDGEFKNKSILLLSGIAFMPQLVFLCSYVNNDLLASLFGLISVYFAVLLFKKDKLCLGLLSVFFAFIGGFTKYTVLIMVPISIIVFFIWLIIRKKIRVILIILSILVFFISAFFLITSFEKTAFIKSPFDSLWNARLSRYDILDVLNTIKTRINGPSFIDYQELAITLKSTVAAFGWANIFTDTFIYKYFLAYALSGFLLLFINIKKYRENKNSIFIIIASIIVLFIYFLLYTIYTGWFQVQGRTIILAVFLTFTLAIFGLSNINVTYKNIIYYSLFSCSLFISVFCLYNYIYLSYY